MTDLRQSDHFPDPRQAERHRRLLEALATRRKQLAEGARRGARIQPGQVPSSEFDPGQSFEAPDSQPLAAEPGSMIANSGSPRAAEDRSMQDLYHYEKEVVDVVDAGPGWTTVKLRDGTIEKRRGVRSNRNQNPGNIEYTEFSRRKGAVGSDGRFAIFPTRQQGLKAMQDLVFGPTYSGKTIADAIGGYAPKNENDSAAYARFIADAAGVPVDTIVSDLTEEQKAKLIDGMVRMEGNRSYQTEVLRQGKSLGTPPPEQSGFIPIPTPSPRRHIPVPTPRPSGSGVPFPTSRPRR